VPEDGRVWPSGHLLFDPTARFHDLRANFHTRRTDTRMVRNHISQLTALGYRVTLAPAA
jgi:hypothetical protein